MKNKNALIEHVPDRRHPGLGPGIHSMHVPGKLILSGEWGVLRPGNSAIVLPTRGITVRIEPAEQIVISSEAYDLKRATYTDVQRMHTPTAQFLVEMIQAALGLLAQRGIKVQTFHLSLENDLLTYVKHDGKLLKLGVGSSASAAVGIIKMITLFHGVQLPASQLFVAASTAHCGVQGKQGSGCDVAVAASGQALLFTRGAQATDCLLKPLVIPPTWHLAVGFAGVSAKTVDLVVLFNQAQLRTGVAIEVLLAQIDSVVQELASAIERDDIDLASAYIHENRQLLKELSVLCGDYFETPVLTQMIELANASGAAAKFSGAGGGDCVIALCPTAQIKQAVHAAWAQAGFMQVSEVLERLPIADNERSLP